MNGCSLGDAPIVKKGHFSFFTSQYPKNDLQKEAIKQIPYAFAIWSLIKAQICSWPDIPYACNVLGRFQSNPWMSTGKLLRKSLQWTKDFVLVYISSDDIEITGYVDSNFARSGDDMKSLSGMCLKWLVEWFQRKVLNRP